MHRIVFGVAIIALLFVSGCSRLSPTQSSASAGSAFGSSVQPVSTAQAIETTSLKGFVDDSVVRQLSSKDQSEATSAQYYALQFGRPGAPRSWQGDSGASGVVSVGPYVRVNTLDCREFSHSVTLTGNKHEKRGTACRETNGSWVVETS